MSIWKRFKTITEFHKFSWLGVRLNEFYKVKWCTWLSFESNAFDIFKMYYDKCIIKFRCCAKWTAVCLFKMVFNEYRRTCNNLSVENMRHEFDLLAYWFCIFVNYHQLVCKVKFSKLQMSLSIKSFFFKISYFTTTNKH